MTSTLNPALCAALIAALPFAVAFIAAMLRDVCQARGERAEGVLATCMGLGLTENHLIIENRENPRRIPLTGLTVDVESGGAGHGSDVRLAVRGAGELIEREELYSYAASGEAQIFATMLTRLSRALQPAGMNSVPTGV
jgi:hypothetical protein